MKIENAFFTQSTMYSPNCRAKNSSFEAAFSNKVTNSQNAEKVSHSSQRDSYVPSYTHVNNVKVSDSIFAPIKTARYEINDASFLEGVPAYTIKDQQTGESIYIREDEIVIQTDAKTGLSFLFNMDQPFSLNLRMTDELKGALEELAESRNFELKNVPMQDGMTVNQDPKTGLKYMTKAGDEAGGACVLFLAEGDKEKFENLVDKFMQHPVVTERSIAGLWAVLEVSGNLKRGKEGFTYLVPDGIRYISYDGDKKKAWDMDFKAKEYALAREVLKEQFDVSDMGTWKKRLNILRMKQGEISDIPFGFDEKRSGYTLK